MSKLFSDDEESVGGCEVQLTVNEHYAKAFEYRKEREELERRMFSVTMSRCSFNVYLLYSKRKIWLGL